jgi:hypothetical protein
MTMRACLRLTSFALLFSESVAAAQSIAPQSEQQSAPQTVPAPGPATGLADSAGLRATVFGTPPEGMALLPAKLPLSENNLE